MEIRLEVSYPSDNYPAWDNKIDKLVGQEHDDSGTGFGKRDLGYYIDDISSALDLFRKLYEIKGVNLFLSTEDDEDGTD